MSTRTPPPPAAVPRERPRWLVTGQRLLTIAPLAALAAFMLALAVDIPFWDQWALTARIDRLFSGEFDIEDLLEPHHEHWMPLPLAIMLALAHLTNWNLAAEVAINFVLGTAMLAVLLRRAQQTDARDGQRSSLLLPTIALLACSITQHANWLWGLQMSVLLSLLGTLACLHLLCTNELRAARLIGALLCALIASSSQFQGNLAWPLGLVAIALSHRSIREARRPLLIWTIATALAAIGAWLVLQTPEDTAAFAHQPLRLVQFVLAYLGAPLMRHSDLGATIAGAIGVLLAGYLLMRTGGPRRAPFASVLLLFASGVALMTSVGRIEYGIEAARASRYVTFATPLWVAVAMLAAGTALPRRASMATLALIWICSLGNALLALPNAQNYANQRAEARQHLREVRDAVPQDPAVFAPLFTDPEVAALMIAASHSPDAHAYLDENRDQVQALLRKHGLDFADAEQIRKLHSDGQMVRTGLVTLKRHRLSVFRED